jgi:hypothetical protein
MLQPSFFVKLSHLLSEWLLKCVLRCGLCVALLVYQKVRDQSVTFSPWVGIHKANFADLDFDFRNCYAQSRLYIGFAC